MNPKFLRNPGKDCSGRRNPIYVSRVLSAMVSHAHSWSSVGLIILVFFYWCRLCECVWHVWILSFEKGCKDSFTCPFRWTVTMTKECCWESGRLALKEVSARCLGGAAWRFCANGKHKPVNLFDLDSAGCLLQSPALVGLDKVEFGIPITYHWSTCLICRMQTQHKQHTVSPPARNTVKGSVWAYLLPFLMLIEVVLKPC